MNAVAQRMWDVGVVVPARNEEGSIARCVGSVLASCRAARQCGQAWIVVVADRCCDRTVELARQRLFGCGEVLECVAGSPGRARRLGCGAVMRHFAGRNPQTLWLANTDADSHVPRDWIGTHLRHAQDSAAAIAGIVQLDSLETRSEVCSQFRRRYELRADGTHPHVHGANFGVRADAYLDVGGWSDVSVSEDHCLWGRLRAGGWRMLSPAACVVTTSGRLQGRATGGFADTLRQGMRIGD